MLYNERAELILRQIQLEATVKVTELAELLHVSVDTVRRDLKALEQKGLVKCVHGGACLPEALAALSNFTGREVIHSDLKREAGRKAAALVAPGNIVALNSGTTNTILAQELAAMNREFTVVTNNYAAVNILMQNEGIRLIAVGGMVDALERSSYGTVCEREMGAFYPDIAFLAINAVSETEGFTDFRLNEIGIIQLLARQSRKTVAVMDSSKLGRCSKKQVLALDEVDLLVMDGNVAEETKEAYRRRGIVIE